jgi:uncharacterized protein YuzE
MHEMGDRRIQPAYIEATVAGPDIVVPDKSDPTLTRSYKRIEEYGGRASCIYLEFDVQGNAIGVEIASASKRGRAASHPKAA